MWIIKKITNLLQTLHYKLTDNHYIGYLTLLPILIAILLLFCYQKPDEAYEWALFIGGFSTAWSVLLLIRNQGIQARYIQKELENSTKQSNFLQQIAEVLNDYLKNPEDSEFYDLLELSKAQPIFKKVNISRVSRKDGTQTATLNLINEGGLIRNLSLSLDKELEIRISKTDVISEKEEIRIWFTTEGKIRENFPLHLTFNYTDRLNNDRTKEYVWGEDNSFHEIIQ